MVNKKKLAKEFANNKTTFDSEFPYLDDIEFLKHLEVEYAKMEEYEICAIIDARVNIFSSREILDERLEHLNNQIRLYKKIKGFK